MRHVIGLLCLAACAVPVDIGGAVPCSKDSECEKFSVCEAQRCVPCPDAGVCPGGPPLNQTLLSRNECPSCTFAPPSTCQVDGDCSSELVCARGQRCVEGCSGISCCANACTPKGCDGLAPVGCNIACSVDLGCSACIAAKCVCTGSTWKCVPTCTSAGFDAGCLAEPF